MKKYGILVVDTKQETVRDLSRILNEEGYYVLTATSAKEASEKLQESAVDLIISNHTMKGISIREL